MSICGIDFSTRAVDVVLLDEDTDAATWHRFELLGNDAFDRARNVEGNIPGRTDPLWDEVVAIGIEDPRGYGAGSLYRVQGAILASLPAWLLVHPLIPSQWRKTVGLPGNASKDMIRAFTGIKRWHADPRFIPSSVTTTTDYEAVIPAWPQDAHDAYCIALATRTLLERVAA